MIVGLSYSKYIYIFFQVYKIIEENEKLKKELILYQKSTKDAFLRSASVLNTEALSLFQVSI